MSGNGRYVVIRSFLVKPMDYVVNIGRVLSVDHTGVFVTLSIETLKPNLTTGQIKCVVKRHTLHEADEVVIAVKRSKSNPGDGDDR